MKTVIFGLLALCVGLSGCAAGSATAGYSLAAKSADDLKPASRQSIIEEAVRQSKEYADATFVRKESQ